MPYQKFNSRPDQGKSHLDRSPASGTECCIDLAQSCLGLIGIKEGRKIKRVGVGFFVSVSQRIKLNDVSSIGKSFSYFVTAKHVAERVRYNGCVVRINNREGGPTVFEAGSIQWFYHPLESAVDIAVGRFASPSGLRWTVETIPEPLFVTPELIARYGICAGHDVYVPELPIRFRLTARNHSPVRNGTLIMLADDHVDLACASSTSTHLIGTRLCVALSGCPVFVQRPFQSVKTANCLKEEPNGLFSERSGESRVGASSFLLGSIGYAYLPPSSSCDIAPCRASNYAVSRVVPIYKMLEVINHPELVAAREAEVEDAKQEFLLQAALIGSRRGLMQIKTATGSDYEIPVRNLSAKSKEHCCSTTGVRKLTS